MSGHLRPVISVLDDPRSRRVPVCTHAIEVPLLDVHVADPDDRGRGS